MTKQADNANTIYLADYHRWQYDIDEVRLRFELDPHDTRVTAHLSLRRPDTIPAVEALRLDGEHLTLQAIRLNGENLAPHRYQVDDQGLTLFAPPAAFTLETVTGIVPADNTALQGLYTSHGHFVTQCEAEGFRRITYFPDRPDCMTLFTTEIIADAAQYPVLLSNGNLIEQETLADGRQRVVWQDPFAKPSYLFALVAGDLACHEATYNTCSGRKVSLRIYVEHHNRNMTEHAMRSLQKAMRWDEERFGREYDLNIYNIVAVDDFNMGAMENKGLNVFNSQFVLARPETATDQDFVQIEAVIGHEYFHNWSGNRVTCRDWFQLSLKEGLTVYREAEFTADMASRAVKRIEDARLLRTAQFAEDEGPMAHPVRPQSYIEINNFYTVTVYEKGAEVVRMIATLLGREGFRRGLDLYFSRHDGEAVTTDDFVRAMSDATGVDLEQFKRWYDQAGTPRVEAELSHDPDAQTATLTLRQHTPATPGQTDKQPFHIPVAVGLLDAQGEDLPLRLPGEAGVTAGTRVLNLTETEQQFTFADIPNPPTPSLLRDFSAPVRLYYDYTDADLTFLMKHDSDPFNRWEAGQRLAIKLILTLIEDWQAGREPLLNEDFVEAVAALLDDQTTDRSLIAEALTLPNEDYLAELIEPVDVDAIHAVRSFVRRSLAERLYDRFLAVYQSHHDRGAYTLNAEAIGRRRLKNLCLAYLTSLETDEPIDMALVQFHTATNMTDTMGALRTLTDRDTSKREQALAEFEQRWQHEPLVMDKWFRLQATADRTEVLDDVRRLMQHPVFSLKNPNRVRALIGAFTQNPVHFHDPTGAGYAFLRARIAELDPLNPQIAARLAKPFSRWRRFEPKRRDLMRKELETLTAIEGLSKDVYEVVSKSLEA